MDVNPSYFTWIPTIALLAYTIPACYYDIKHREMPVNFWAPMILIGLPVTAYLYWTGTYPWYLGALSLAVAGIYYMIFQATDIMQGADFMYLFFISVFLVQNPVSGNILMPVPYAIFLVTSVVILGIFYNIPQVKQRLVTNTLPGMLTISLALVLTVAFG